MQYVIIISYNDTVQRVVEITGNKVMCSFLYFRLIAGVLVAGFTYWNHCNMITFEPEVFHIFLINQTMCRQLILIVWSNLIYFVANHTKDRNVDFIYW